MKKSFIIMGCSMLVGISLLTGCTSKKSDETEYQAETAQNLDDQEQKGSMQMVKVTGIDGDTITADVGETDAKGPQGSMEPPSQDGEKPEGDQADGQPPEGSMEPPSQDGKKQDGDKDGKGGQPGDMGEKEFTSSGKTITFTVTDDTEISKGNGEDTETASLDDISKDTILMVEVDDDNQATKIMIR
jgi:hypothetical protein